jgi:hypothetical protein
MRTPSIRTLAAIAHERGEEFDPGDPAMLSPALAERLERTSVAGTTVFALPSPEEVRLEEIAC